MSFRERLVPGGRLPVELPVVAGDLASMAGGADRVAEQEEGVLFAVHLDRDHPEIVDRKSVV